MVRDLVERPIVHRPFPVPRSEDRRDRFPQLTHGVLRKVFADLVTIQLLEFRHDRLQLGGAEVRVSLGGRFFLVAVQDRFEPVAVDVLDDPPKHRDEPTIRVPREPFVRRPREGLEGRVVEA